MSVIIWLKSTELHKTILSVRRIFRGGSTFGGEPDLTIEMTDGKEVKFNSYNVIKMEVIP